MSLSVVICTKDRRAELATCLDSIIGQQRLPLEVIVVDASARPARDVFARFRERIGTSCEARLIEAPPGLPRQRNIGARAARGDVVVFFDDDVVLEREYLEALAAVYERDTKGAIGGVGGAQVPDPTPREPFSRRLVSKLFLLESYGIGRVKRSGHPEYVLCPKVDTDVEFLSGCNMSFRRTVFDEFAFDERLCGYALGEDLEFSYRVSRRFRLMLTSAARVDHRHTGGGRPLGNAFREMAVLNRFRFFRENVARRRLDWVLYVWAAIGDVLLRLPNPRARGLVGIVRGHLRTLGDRSLEAVPASSAGTRAIEWSPLVSVVVPARNEAGFIGPCLESISAQTYPAERIEVIVVENNSTDRTADLVLEYASRDPRIRLVRSQATNQAEAMNEGIFTAHGTLIARVDAHSHVAPEYLAEVVAAFARHPDAVGVGGPFLPAGQTLLERVTGLARSSRLGVGGGYGSDREPADHVVRSVQCGAYRRDALVRVGLFDVAMAYGEDEELNWRLVRQGGRIWLCPALSQFYRPRPTLRALTRQYWNYGQGRLRVVMKHPRFLLPRHLVPSLFVLGLVGLAAVGVVVPTARIALAALAGLWGLVLVGAGVTARGGWQERLLVPVAVACVHVGYGAGMLWGMARHVLGRPRIRENGQWRYVTERLHP